MHCRDFGMQTGNQQLDTSGKKMQHLSRVTWFLCLVSINGWIVGAKGEEEENWITSRVETISILPDSCATFDFKAGKESEYRLNLTQMHFPPGCSPDVHLRWTPSFYYRGSCLQTKWNDPDKCEVPSAKGIRDASDMCQHWDQLTTNLLGDVDEYVTQGTLCFEEEDYFLAMRSTCTRTIDIEITVETRSLNSDEMEACKFFQRFFEQAAAAAFLFIFFMAIIPIIAIAVGITLCCCFCPHCPCYESRKRRNQMVQNVQIAQLQPSQYASSPSATSPPRPGYERGVNVPQIPGMMPLPAYGQPGMNPFGAPGYVQPAVPMF